MRQALGLGEGAASQRAPQRREPDARGRRFVKDGEVPVVMLSGSREAVGPGPAPINRVAAAEAALRAERAAHEHAEHSLRDALAHVQRLETQLAHAEMAHREALAAERQGREQAEHALAEATAARQTLEQRIEGLEQRIAETEAAAAPVQAPAADVASTAKRGRGKAAAKPRRESAGTPKREPQPVKWWLPSYKAKLRKR
jgi:DNA repair exonuclease SbcCD ATPase subunit